jgi:hypothetical protein
MGVAYRFGAFLSKVVVLGATALGIAGIGTDGTTFLVLLYPDIFFIGGICVRTAGL